MSSLRNYAEEYSLIIPEDASHSEVANTVFRWSCCGLLNYRHFNTIDVDETQALADFAAKLEKVRYELACLRRFENEPSTDQKQRIQIGGGFENPKKWISRLILNRSTKRRLTIPILLLVSMTRKSTLTNP